MKVYESNEELYNKISKGVKKLADNVGATLGPKGRNVILRPKNEDGTRGQPVVTKDGVTVARFVEFEDEFEDTGAAIVKQAAIETVSAAGDGTTTSTVLADAIFQESKRYLFSDISPVAMKRGMDVAVEQVTEQLTEMARPIQSKEDIEHIATISANGETSIGKLISDAVDSVGRDGSIVVEKGSQLKTKLDLVEGFRFDSGYAAGAFVNKPRLNIVKHEKPLILVTDHIIDDLDEIMNIFKVVDRQKQPFIIVADEVRDKPLAACIYNAMNKRPIAVVKPPRYGKERKDIMQDLADSIGARFISTQAGDSLSSVTLPDLGTADSIEISKTGTTVVGGHGETEKIDERIEGLRSLLKQLDDIDEGKTVQERITRMSAGAAVIRVGGSTEVEVTERKHRIEDALEAVNAAKDDGVLPGGGVALMYSTKLIDLKDAYTQQWESLTDEERVGYGVIMKALKAPFSRMATNAGLSPEVCLNKVFKDGVYEANKGIDFTTGEYISLYDEGIIDPTKVTINALRNATSAAGTLITACNAIVER